MLSSSDTHVVMCNRTHNTEEVTKRHVHHSTSLDYAWCVYLRRCSLYEARFRALCKYERQSLQCKRIFKELVGPLQGLASILCRHTGLVAFQLALLPQSSSRTSLEYWVVAGGAWPLACHLSFWLRTVWPKRWLCIGHYSSYSINSDNSRSTVMNEPYQTKFGTYNLTVALPWNTCSLEHFIILVFVEDKRLDWRFVHQLICRQHSCQNHCLWDQMIYSILQNSERGTDVHDENIFGCSNTWLRR